MSKKQPIRVAMIRCDIHAYFFATLMTQANPNRLHKNCPLVHRFMTDPEHADRFQSSPVSGFRFVRAWDPDHDLAKQFSETYRDSPDVCQSPKEAIIGIDAAFISCCSLDGSDHLELARPFLRAGLPTFIDKPFAASYKDAKAIVRLAEQYQAPLMAASMLHQADGTTDLRQRQSELGELGLAIIRGSHGWETKSGLEGITHGIAMALAIYGHNVDWVECMGELPREFILMHYPHGGKVLVINMDQAYWPDRFQADAWGRRSRTTPPAKTHLRSTPIGDAEFPAAGMKLVRQFRQMVRTRKTPVPYPHLLKWVKVAEAAERAQKTSKRVYLRN